MYALIEVLPERIKFSQVLELTFASTSCAVMRAIISRGGGAALTVESFPQFLSFLLLIILLGFLPEMQNNTIHVLQSA